MSRHGCERVLNVLLITVLVATAFHFFILPSVVAGYNNNCHLTDGKRQSLRPWRKLFWWYLISLTFTTGWIMVRIRFSLNRKEVRGSGRGGGGHWEKKEVDGGLVNCSKNKIALQMFNQSRLMINLIFQNRVAVNFPRNLTFITFNYCHLSFIPLKYFSFFYWLKSPRLILLLGHIFAHSKNSKSRSLFKNEKYFF